MVCVLISVVSGMSLFRFFFFKQKTAYEMRISDWSSDVCSSDLSVDALARQIVLGGVGAAIAQSEVVFAGAALVGVAFDRDANLRILGEPCGLGVQRGGRGAVQLIAVEGE